MSNAASSKPQPGAVKPLNLPQTSRFVLSNGLKVIALYMPNVPLVTVQLGIAAGDAYSPQGLGGLYGAVARLLPQGCGDYDAVTFSQRLDDCGASIQAHGGADYINVTGSCLAGYLPEYLQLVADMVTSPRFDDQEVMIDQQNTIQELAYMRSLPAVMARQTLNSSLYGDHPYGAKLPSDAEVMAAGAAELKSAHKRRFVPEDSTLVVVGQYQQETLQSLIESAFGGWVGSADDTVLAEVVKVQTAQKVVLVNRPGSVQVDLRIGQLAMPGLYRNYHVLNLFNAAFGGRAGSMLFMNVREKYGYAYSVGSGFGVNKRGGSFSMSAQVRNDVVGHAIELMLADMAQVCENGLTDEQLQASKNYLDGQFCIGTSTQNGIASSVLRSDQFERPEDDLYTLRSRIQQVDNSLLKGVLHDVLQPEHNIIVAVGDAEAVKSQLDQFGDVAVVEPS